MSFSHESVAALPVATDADKAAIRAMCTRRFAYALTASESATDFVAVDPATGVVPLYLIQNSTLFAYDSTDSTTAHDGATCLVSSDGKRFKSDTIAPPYSVLDKDTIAQPVSPAPSVGDRYLIPTSATGTDWAGQDGKIGIYTAAGWRFAISPVGRFLYVEDETAFYHRNTSGAWTAGVGSITHAANSISITHILGAKASFVVKVENQTTNAPPATPVAPVAYIIGPSPTGAWSGNAGKLAICLIDGVFTIITPDTGDTVYDKSIAQNYRFNGSAWVLSAGSVISFFRSFSTSPAVTAAGGAYYVYNAATPPSSSHYRTALNVGLTFTPKSSISLLKFKISGTPGFSSSALGDVLSGSFPICIALFRDAETNAIAWAPLCPANPTFPAIDKEFIVASDGANHQFRWVFTYGGDNSATPADSDVFVQTVSGVDQSCMEILL